MFIKSIILDGFKSYGQRTEIAGFDDQFNAITGLNGSGKSNILDSICFLLGITNLTHVRATSLQDLIYRSGQAGINKATVSITFDNTNPSQCPPGFETYKEITITRQIVMGGKNKYMINGTNVPNKKVQDLFCSIQLNVNNPHFLIMQGKITKVLNMKPPEILAMVEEAAGTRMYEVKRQFCQKTIEKKEAKLLELTAVAKDEISPKLEKLREERSQYLEYQRVERELEHMLELYHVWQYFDAKRLLSQAEKSLQEGSTKTKSLEDNITKNKVTIKELEDDVEEITKNNKTEASEKLNSIEVELKEQGKLEAKATALAQSVKDNISAEVKQKKQFEKNVIDDTKVLQLKEEELNNVQSLFETLKINDVNDNEALLLAQRKFEALSAGMEVNEDGEAETLQEQLINAKQEASQADTESKQALMQLKFCQSQLEEKQKDLVNTSDIQKDTVEMENLEKQVRQLDSNIRNINYSEERMNELLEKRRTLQYEIRGLREKVERFEAQRPYAKFSYRDPESNFNRSKVHGVVGRLINCKDNSACTAIETAAGGRLYDVVVDNDVTSKKLLKHGNLQQRTTFIPLNKIQSHRMDENIIRYAQELVGKENCQSALSLLNYEKNLQPAMDFIFGNVFICKDLNIARQVTFNDRIRRRCVTLDGDVTDPAGVLSGGARKKGGSVLLQIQEIKDIENTLRINEKELQNIERELNALSSVQENYTSLMRQLDVKKHELQLVKQRVQNTAHHRQQEEVNNLKVQISELTQKVKHCKDIVAKCNQKAKELETKMKDSKGYREKQLKEAEKEMAKLKKQAENSRKEWKQREQDYETLKLEISELKKGIENTKAQIKKSEETQVELEEKHQELLQNASELTEKVSNLRMKVKEMKTAIAHKNKEIQEKINKKEKLIAQNTEYELQIQQYAHDIKKLQDDVRNAKTKEQELSKRIKDDGYLDKAKDMSHKDGLDLERRIRSAQEKKQKLSRTVNAKAQSMFEHEEKQFLELRKKQRIVENDRNKMITVLNDLDQKKKNSLKLAFEQVSKDFGSIFGTLLPGANARLAAPLGKTILEGIEIKVSLGGVWKDSLTELSGGQRSLAALSLILAMLLFKPAPLYILDEVDAALDLSHTQNIGNMLKSHFKKSQFIIVSLKDGMFNNANVLFKTKFVDGVSTVGRTVNKRH